MLKIYNENLESVNYIDNVNFTKDDPCVWIVYPPGASGDLLGSIINRHYINTGSLYFGITKRGRVYYTPSDSKTTQIRSNEGKPLFDQEHFYEIAEHLGYRNLNYSLLDQFIFCNHLHGNDNIDIILENFPKAKIIQIYTLDSNGDEICRFMKTFKNQNVITELDLTNNTVNELDLVKHNRVLNIPFGSLFVEKSYYQWYDNIINFLELEGRLICFDFIKYYLSTQHHLVRSKLEEYSLQHV